MKIIRFTGLTIALIVWLLINFVFGISVIGWGAMVILGLHSKWFGFINYYFEAIKN